MTDIIEYEGKLYASVPEENLPLLEDFANSESRQVTAWRLEEVYQERAKQDDKWGVQNHPNGTGGDVDVDLAYGYKRECEIAHANGMGTWKQILREEVYEAFAEADPTKLRAELVQVAAVAVAWVEAIDRASA